MDPSLFSAVRNTCFVNVILPLAISKTYTYRIPHEWSDKIAVGMRVIVQFGKNKIYSAIVKEVTELAPERYEAKYVLDILDQQPIVDGAQLKLWEWMASYYMCTLGEVMQAALPAALKLASETKIIASDQEGLDKSQLSDKEYMIMEALEIAGELRVSDIVKLLGQKTVFPILKQLFDNGFLMISEEISERYKPKKKTTLF
ncbi:hypothetical protein HMPREF0765_1664 [Sphingobacterium spiritivorum ATCC 33300]|uniref:Primosomal protein N' 3' DNA-binding domain-containing protein n=1 Tax=Sphingobacterium spiritivorum ATCC 33300 TaxID=525372 RepID=C2FWF8_SPHSI|nr:hypothetical protein [Sphingobacterium spiritivorum]EEI92709.1 hypothetical protein HMPREF0765_1664 [Sphingobacterium spiritivorum ATCC 33300]